jgi:hypothetical protein
VARTRELLAEDPTLIGFELWDGQRKVAEERRRAGVMAHDTWCSSRAVSPACSSNAGPRSVVLRRRR